MKNNNNRASSELLEAKLNRRRFIKASGLGATGLLAFTSTSTLLSNTVLASGQELRLDDVANPGIDDETEALQAKVNQAIAENKTLVIANRKHLIKDTVFIRNSGLTMTGEGPDSEIFIDKPADKNYNETHVLYIGDVKGYENPPYTYETPKTISNITLANLTLSTRIVTDRGRTPSRPPVPLMTRGVKNSIFKDLRIVGGDNGWTYDADYYYKDSEEHAKKQATGRIYPGDNVISRISFHDCALWAFNIRGNGDRAPGTGGLTKISDVNIRNCNVGLVVSNEGTIVSSEGLVVSSDIVRNIEFNRISATQCDTPLHLEVAEHININNSIFRALSPGDAKWDQCLNGLDNKNLNETTIANFYLSPLHYIVLDQDSEGKDMYLTPYKGKILISNTKNLTFSNCELTPRIVDNDFRTSGQKLNEVIHCWTNSAHPVKDLTLIGCKINGTFGLSAPIGKHDTGIEGEELFGKISFDGCDFGKYVVAPIVHVRVEDVGQTWIKELSLTDCTLHGPIDTHRTRKMTVTGGTWYTAITRHNKIFAKVDEFSLTETVLHLSPEYNSGYVDSSPAVRLSGENNPNSKITFKPGSGSTSTYGLEIRNYNDTTGVDNNWY